MSGNRKELRLKSFSYSETAAYFITICCRNGEHLLAEIEAKASRDCQAVGVGVLDDPSPPVPAMPGFVRTLTGTGKIVESKINEMSQRFSGADIDTFVVMPNHIHLLLSVYQGKGSSRTPTPTAFSETDRKRSNERIPAFVSYLKRSTNRESGIEIWQRGYYDHVIRDHLDYCRIWDYINNNPYRWYEDKYYT